MSSLFDLLSTAMFCMTLLGIALMVVLALPQSKMRDVMKNVMLVICSVIYVLSPIDLMPEIALGPLGLFDDFGAIVVGYMAARNAMKSEVKQIG